MTNYQLLMTEKYEDIIPVSIYRSCSTGIKVVVADIPGPIVNGYLLLATEAHDDDGLPHTLEHLVFLGSEDYPYKGLLDTLANRCLAQGTNAWTDTDHTCYTVETAGSEGFLNFLPLFVEHILYPTLTDSGFVTEVYHVNETGEDSGVVYCEMQGRENTGESRCHLEMIREIYPGKCGYKSETGGIMKNLRESTTNVKVRNYHHQYYRPDNLTIIITGQVKAEEVFSTLAKFEEKVQSKLARTPLEPMDRPWSSPVPPYEKSVSRTVLFPNDTEDKGMVYYAFRGTKSHEIYKSLSVQIVMDYFVETSVAPLRQAFVENADPLCGNVRWSCIETTEGVVYFRFVNVDAKRLGEVKEKFFETIKAELEKGLKMERIASIIERKRLESLNALEDSPHDTICSDIIGHALFCSTQEELRLRFNSIQLYRQASGEPEAYWNELMGAIVAQPHVEIIGSPSVPEKQRLAQETEGRVAKRKEDLGEQGLLLKAHQLEIAAAENDKEPPDEMLTMLPVPDAGKIGMHNVGVSSNYRATDQPTAVPLHTIPFATHLDDIPETQFVAWSLLFDSSKLPSTIKPLLPLWTELIGETAVKLQSGEVLSYEEVVSGLERDLLGCSCELGLNGHCFNAGSFPETVCLYMKVDRDADLKKYHTGVQWAARLLFDSHFEKERVKAVITKILNAVDQVKRQGRSVVGVTYNRMVFGEGNNIHYSLVLNMERTLKQALLDIEENPDTFLSQFSSISRHLTDPSRLRLHLTTAVSRFPSPEAVLQPWVKSFLPQLASEVGDTARGPDSLVPCFLPIQSCTLKRAEGEVDPRSAIVGVGAVESSFLVQSCNTPITTYNHPDIPALMVAIEYLITLEGPMWRLIRGLGFSYGFSIRLSVESGLLTFSLYKATNVVKAYEKAVEIVSGFLEGSSEFEEDTLETIKSSVLYEIIEREKTIGDAAAESLNNHFRQMDKHYNKELLQKVSQVSVEEVERVFQEYFPALFDAGRSVCAVCCHPNKLDEVARAFLDMPPPATRTLHKYENFESLFN